MLGALTVLCEAAPSCPQSFSRFLCSVSLALYHVHECIGVQKKEACEVQRCTHDVWMGSVYRGIPELGSSNFKMCDTSPWWGGGTVTSVAMGGTERELTSLTSSQSVWILCDRSDQALQWRFSALL